MNVAAPTPVRSVYVHAPFCARRCPYCDFAVQVRRTGDAVAWLEALRAELAFVRGEGLFRIEEPFSTLYVGGGTPSLLGAGAMAGLTALFGGRLLSREDLEWTAEANPESFTNEVARGWRAAGVNRLSLGVQTFHEPALRWMGRLHGSEGARAAVAIARAAGLADVSVDLIFGLPARLGRSWRDDLERVLSLDVPHVSLYGLTVEPATPLGLAVREGREEPVDEERYREEFLAAAELLRAEGYEHYEVSNFARPGHASRHNAAYWTGEAYLGLGNGAHSYAPPVRRWNHRAWDEYAGATAGGHGGEEGREVVGEDARRLEQVWLGLRTSDGIPCTGLSERARAVADAWASRGLARVEEGRVRLGLEGWLLLDRLAVELDTAQQAAAAVP